MPLNSVLLIYPWLKYRIHPVYYLTIPISHPTIMTIFIAICNFFDIFIPLKLESNFHPLFLLHWMLVLPQVFSPNKKVIQILYRCVMQPLVQNGRANFISNIVQFFDVFFLVKPFHCPFEIFVQYGIVHL